MEEESERRADNEVNEELKQKWEREQLKLKEKMIPVDTEDWARFRLVAEENNEWTSPPPLTYVGGVDISFIKGDAVRACAALVVCKLPKMEVVHEDCSMVELTAPYIPGFLAFREADFLVEKFNALKETNPDILPQLLMVDGNGILHSRGFGLACHLGVLLNTPSMGVAKTLFHVDGIENNEHHKKKIQEQLLQAGDRFPLVGDSGKTYGMALQSCNNTRNPIYISKGHKISLETALWAAEKCILFRIPEPTRQADLRSREYIRQLLEPPKKKGQTKKQAAQQIDEDEEESD